MPLFPHFEKEEHVMKRLTVFASMLLLSFVLIPAGSAQRPSFATPPNGFYAIDASDNKLAALSLKAQTVKLIGSLGPQASDGALALAFCPPGGLVPYTIVNPFDSDAQLATLDLRAGLATRVGSPLPSDQVLDIMGMTCSRQGTLYAIGQFLNPDGSLAVDFNSLYTVDRETGQATRIGSTGVLDTSDASGAFGFLMALAFAPNGKLYGVNSASTLFSIDKSTGTATKIVDLYTASEAGLVRLVNVMGLAIDSRGNFYVADFVPQSHVYALDFNAGVGVATPVMGANFTVHNIAFRTPY
jgi:hypothetical protein